MKSTAEAAPTYSSCQILIVSRPPASTLCPPPVKSTLTRTSLSRTSNAVRSAAIAVSTAAHAAPYVMAARDGSSDDA